MGGAGTNPLSRDLSVLNDREREIYVCAVDRHSRGLPTTCRAIAEELRMPPGTVMSYRWRIRRKVAWPIPVAYVRSGTHNLTPSERSVLLAACELHDGGEYPSVRVVAALLGLKSPFPLFAVRADLVRKKLWPCRVRSGPGPLSPVQVAFLVDYRTSGRTMGHQYGLLASAFRERFGRTVTPATIYKVFLRLGLTTLGPSCSSLRTDVEVRKAQVIAEREGFAPRKLEEPSAYARACRRSKFRTISSSRQVQS